MDLRVEIPRKFKKSLEQRFDLRRVKHEVYRYNEVYFIQGKCELCFNYLHKYGHCGHCPFGKFRRKGLIGCVYWIERVIGERYCFALNDVEVYWEGTDDRKVREQIEKLKRKARKLITWV